jgi:acyl-CoA thioester hydrolase
VPGPFVHRLRVRVHEADAQAIVFNANWFMYFDVAMNELLRSLLGSYAALVDAGADFVVREAAARFHAPGRFDDALDIELPIERLGSSSIVVTPRALRDGVLLVDGRIVHVCVDPQTLAKRDIPDLVRERLRPWVTGVDDR